MKYVVVHAGKEHDVQVRALQDQRFEVTAFGSTFEVSAQTLPGGGLFLERDNQVFSLDPDERVQVLSAREAQQRRMHAATEGEAGSWEIKAPMPGKVVTLLVQPGQEVAAGQGLIVIEAMKMENELRAPKAGVIGTIHVQPGATVEARAVLISSMP